MKKGEILVNVGMVFEIGYKFQNLEEEIIADTNLTKFGELLEKYTGYKFLGSQKHNQETFVFQVPKGREEEICQELRQEYPKYISQAYPRDYEHERRLDEINILKEKIESLDEVCERGYDYKNEKGMPFDNREYFEALNQLKDLVEKFLN